MKGSSSANSGPRKASYLRQRPTKSRLRIATRSLSSMSIDHVDREHTSLNWWYRHNAMHARTIPMLLDEFGRCAYCVKRGFWKPDA